MKPDAEYFDSWYADRASSPRADDLVRRTLGLPPELQSTSLLTWSGIADVAAALAVSPDATVLDLACGRGGYGMEIARRSGARVVGVDFSAVALDEARGRAPSFGLGDRAQFVVGDLAATGLAEASVSAVMCLDAIQFSLPVSAALAECRRVLVPGGRCVLTCWEARDRSDPGVPARLRGLDLSRELSAAGFLDVKVTDQPVWRAAEQCLWEAVVAVDPAGDPALRSLSDEGLRALEIFDRLRRVMAVGTCPD